MWLFSNCLQQTSQIIKERNHTMDPRLIRLRMELFTAAQTLKGEDAKEFWQLINDVKEIEVLYNKKN